MGRSAQVRLSDVCSAKARTWCLAAAILLLRETQCGMCQHMQKDETKQNRRAWFAWLMCMYK